MAGVVAWRSLLTTAAWIPVAVLVILLWNRNLRPITLGLLIPAVVLSGVATASLGVGPSTAAARRSGRLTVLSWNINGSLVSAPIVVAETLRHSPSVVVLPDIDDQEYAQVAASLTPHGYVAVRSVSSQGAILSRDGYRYSDASPVPGSSFETVAESGSPELPRIVAVHLPIPFTPGGVNAWNAEVARLGAICHQEEPTITVGDFNATDDNIAGTALASCADAAAVVGKQHRGTWPTTLPAAVGIPIDHLFTSPTGPQIADFTVLTDEDHSGANHRPTFTTLNVKGSR